MDPFDHVMAVLFNTLRQAYGVRRVADDYEPGHAMTFREAIAVGKEVTNPAMEDFVEILKRCQGNRRDGTPMPPKDVAMVFAAIHRRCVEVLEGDDGSVGSPDGGD